ncbi:MAG: ParA family protein [Phycisphaerales bacterium]
MRTIAIVNQKGGCGKTTTAINLGGIFAAAGYKTLLVDMDPQGHCAAGLAIPEQRIDVHIGDAMLALAQHPPRPFDHDRLLWRVSRNLDLAPSTMKLAGLEASRGDFAGQPGAETRLARVLRHLGHSHDICLIDCSPAIGMLAFNALVAADEVLIPVETGFFSLQGATKQVNTIKALARRLGASPTYRLLATLHNADSIMAAELLDELRRRFGAKLIPSPIRFDQRLREAASFGQSIGEYAPDSAGAIDYRTLAQWLVDNKPALRHEPDLAHPDAPAPPPTALSASSLMSEIADEMLGTPVPSVLVPDQPASHLAASV